MSAGQNDNRIAVNTKGERMKRRFTLVALLLLLVGSLAASCGGSSKSSEGDTDKGGEGGAKAKVTLQLKWVTQAQFAGY